MVEMKINQEMKGEGFSMAVKGGKGMALLFAALLLVLVVSGCANKSGSNASSTPDGSGASSSGSGTPENVTIRFAWWGSDPRHQATLKAIEKYMELNPHVKIEPEYMGFDGYEKKLVTQFAGATAPDVFQYNNAFSDQLGDFIYDQKQLLNLIDTSHIPESVINDSGMYKGKLTMIPGGIITAAVIYNADFFQKFGIPEDTVWTWDNLVEYGKKVHEQDPNAYLLTADIDVIEKFMIAAYITQKNGKLWVGDDYTLGAAEEQFADAYRYLKSLYESGALEPFGDSTAFVGKMEQNPKWVKGEIGMVIDYVTAYDKYAKAVEGASVKVGPFPMHPNAVQSANPLVGANGFAISKDTKHVEEVAKFVNWMLNDKEAAVLLTTQRGIPPSSVALDAIVEAGLLNPEIKKGVDLASKHKSLPLTPLSDNASLRLVHEETIQKVIYSRVSPEDGAKEAVRNMAEKLAELKK